MSAENRDNGWVLALAALALAVWLMRTCVREYRINRETEAGIALYQLHVQPWAKDVDRLKRDVQTLGQWVERQEAEAARQRDTRRTKPWNGRL